MVIPIKKEVPLHSLLGDFNLNLITIASAVHLLHYKRKKMQVLCVLKIFFVSNKHNGLIQLLPG